jgi:hypothetical protein
MGVSYEGMRVSQFSVTINYGFASFFRLLRSLELSKLVTLFKLWLKKVSFLFLAVRR